jgi:outer membrane receptor protein involved in Fe transport
VTKKVILSSTGVLASLIATSPAFAQEAGASGADAVPPQQAASPRIAAECEVDPKTGECQIIYVTGSRIRRPNLKSPLPVTSIQGTEFFENGKVSVGDTLNDLPALRSTFSQANSTRFRGAAGLNLLDLRGLGTERTLVLVDGRRHVGGDALGTGVAVDINSIPAELIERVDVVAGGNSAVYGSDAIAGVVNFVLKQHYDGFQLRAQDGLSTYGDAGSSFLGMLAGRNFSDGRGNVVVAAEYSRRAEYFASDRPWLLRADGFVNVDLDPPELPGGSDGVPDRRFLHDLHNSGFTNTGLVRFNTGQCGADPSGVAYNCPFQFLPDGMLVPLTGTRAGLGPGGAFVGGNGENFRGGDQLQLAPGLDRFNVTLLGHFEVSPALVPFIEATFVHSKSSGTGDIGHAAFSGVTTGDPRERPRLNNPYLSDQARALIIEQLTLQNGVPPAANARFSLRENLYGLPATRENAVRKTLNLVGGVRGKFNDDWTYEISGSYGRLREKTKILGNLNVQRYLLAVDAAVNPSNGQIECRSRFDPAARIGLVDQGVTLDNDVAACTPLNLFGGNITPEQADYLLLDTVAFGRTSQFDVTGFVGGDTSRFLNLPGGPISFVAGLEYRASKLFYEQDPRITQGYTFYNSIPTFSPPTSKVKEAFAEARIPIASDRPLLQLLELDAAVRASDYSLGKTGTVWAYNASVQWSPLRGLRLRGAYARAVRAPNQGELFTPPSQNFASAFLDPCSARNIGAGSANRAANCAAAGRPTSTFGTPPYGPNGFDFAYADALEFAISGNPDLKAEKSDSVTLGGVVTPGFLPGFSLSADYFSIVVNKVIASASAQAIVNTCYDAASLDNPFCALFQRNTVPDTIIPNPLDPANPQIIGNGPHGEFQFQIIEGSLTQQPLNFAKLRARGIDLEIAYRRQVKGIGRFDSRLIYTHVFERTENLDPTDPSRKEVLMMELGDPQDSFNWNSSLQRGRLTVGYQLRYISKMVLNQYEDIFSVQGRPPQNADYADRRFYPHRFYHDVRAVVEAGARFSFYLGADNVTNAKPPLGLTGITSGGAIYDNRGRFLYAGVTAQF